MYFYKKKQMWIFTDEEKDSAHSISTIDYLQRNYGLTFKQDGRGYRCREHNSLFVHADQKAWYWNSRGMGGGDLIEFVMKYENKSYADALVQVINPLNENTVSYIKAPERTEPQERELSCGFCLFSTNRLSTCGGPFLFDRFEVVGIERIQFQTLDFFCRRPIFLEIVHEREVDSVSEQRFDLFRVVRAEEVKRYARFS